MNLHFLKQSVIDDLFFVFSGCFEISFNNLDYSNSLTIEANQSKTVYVRFNPSKIQTYNGNINIQNTQATDVKINLSGEGIQLKYNYKTFSKINLEII